MRHQGRSTHRARFLPGQPVSQSNSALRGKDDPLGPWGLRWDSGPVLPAAALVSLVRLIPPREDYQQDGQNHGQTDRHDDARGPTGDHGKDEGRGAGN
jgi:hypothetical protein